jgi:Protein of unknown function (DUF3089)
MVSALLLGGNVQVPTRNAEGGSFKNIPICRSASQVGCVIAYSSFGATPPTTSFFCRPCQGVSLQAGQTTSAGQRVACVNPVTFGRSPGALLPYFLTATSPTRGVTVFTPWVTYPGLYTAQCTTSSGASWLQVRTGKSLGHVRPTVAANLGPNWGFHLSDMNLALGDLVRDVTLQEAAYR